MVSDPSNKSMSSVEYDSTTHDVDSVTVYQSDRAEVSAQCFTQHLRIAHYFNEFAR